MSFCYWKDVIRVSHLRLTVKQLSAPRDKPAGPLWQQLGQVVTARMEIDQLKRRLRIFDENTCRRAFAAGWHVAAYSDLDRQRGRQDLTLNRWHRTSVNHGVRQVKHQIARFFDPDMGKVLCRFRTYTR